jgi:SAM-dependent methyltransferase
MRANSVKSVLDVGCGDWQISRLMDWRGIDYTGVDVSSVVLSNTRKFSKEGIRFLELNAVTDDLPNADLLIMKDVIQHWSNTDIKGFLPKLEKFKRVLITNGFHPSGTLNNDISVGDYRYLALEIEPFNVKGDYIFWYQGDEIKRVFYIHR